VVAQNSIFIWDPTISAVYVRHICSVDTSAPAQINNWSATNDVHDATARATDAFYSASCSESGSIKTDDVLLLVVAVTDYDSTDFNCF